MLSRNDGESFYAPITCSIAGTTVTIPQFTVHSTEDSSSPNATYIAVLYDENDARAGIVWANHRIPTHLGSTVSHLQLMVYNTQTLHINPNVRATTLAGYGITDGQTTLTDYDDLKLAVQFAQLTGHTTFSYTGDDLTNKSVYTDNTLGTKLFNVDYTYSSGNLSVVEITRVADAAVSTKAFTYSSGNLTAIEAT